MNLSTLLDLYIKKWFVIVQIYVPNLFNSSEASRHIGLIDYYGADLSNFAFANLHISSVCQRTVSICQQISFLTVKCQNFMHLHSYNSLIQVLIYISILGFSLSGWLNDSQFPTGSVLEPWVVEHLKQDLKLSAQLLNPACIRTSEHGNQNNWNSSCKADHTFIFCIQISVIFSKQQTKYTYIFELQFCQIKRLTSLISCKCAL